MLQRFLALALAWALSILLAACGTDSGDADRRMSTTAVTGQSILLRVGGFELFVPGVNVGGGTDQIPNGATVSLERIDNIAGSSAVTAVASGESALSPSYSVTITDVDGTDISTRTLASVSRITMFPNPGAVADSGASYKELQLIRVSGETATSLNYSDTPSDDANYVLTGDGWIQASLTSFSDFVIVSGGTPASGGGGGGGTTPTALSGTLQDIASTAYVMTLSDSTSGDSVTCSFPASAVASLPATIACNVTTFSADLNNRAVVLNASGTQYSTNATGASAQIVVDTLSGSVATGSITGVLIAGDASSRTIDYTFTTTDLSGGNTSDKTLAVTAGSQLDVNTGDGDAHLGRIIFNGNEYVGIWITGASAPYSVRTRNISTDGVLQGTEGSFTPSGVNFSSATDLEAAYGNSTIMLVSTTATDTSGDVVAVLLDQNANPMGTPVELTLATSAGAPRVAYNATSGTYAVAWQLDAGGVSVALYDNSGSAVGTTTSLSSGASDELRGIASAGDAGEFLVTWTDGSGIIGRRVDAADGTTLGTADISFTATATTGGAAGWDNAGSAYLVTFDEGGTLMVTRLSSGSDTPSAGVGLSILGGADHILGGSNGSVVVGAVNVFQGVESNATTPLVMDGSVIPATSGISFTFHTSESAPGVAADTNTGFMVIGVDDQGDTGVRVFRMTISE